VYTFGVSAPTINPARESEAGGLSGWQAAYLLIWALRLIALFANLRSWDGQGLEQYDCDAAAGRFCASR
jgi:hypothetical protein